MDVDAARGRALVEESREAVVVLDAFDRVVLASRRARQSVEDLQEGEPLPPDLLTGERGVIPLVVPYEADGHRERLVYLSRQGDLAAYEELRSGFTAAVSHELRTPLARLLTLLETATLPGEDVVELVDGSFEGFQLLLERDPHAWDRPVTFRRVRSKASGAEIGSGSRDRAHGRPRPPACPRPA